MHFYQPIGERTDSSNMGEAVVTQRDPFRSGVKSSEDDVSGRGLYLYGKRLDFVLPFPDETFIHMRVENILLKSLQYNSLVFHVCQSCVLQWGCCL